MATKLLLLGFLAGFLTLPAFADLRCEGWAGNTCFHWSNGVKCAGWAGDDCSHWSGNGFF